MWLSEKAARGSRDSEPGAQVGTVTGGGARPSVMLEGEKRRLEIASPGGFSWAAKEGEQVLVARCGDEDVVCGVLRSSSGLSPGEVFIKSSSASVLLRNDGVIELRGVVNVVGSLFLNGVNIIELLSRL